MEERSGEEKMGKEIRRFDDEKRKEKIRCDEEKKNDLSSRSEVDGSRTNGLVQAKDGKLKRKCTTKRTPSNSID